MKKYYDAAKESFTTQPQLTLREILVTVPASDKGINVAEDDAAKAKAEESAASALEAGEPFAQARRRCCRTRRPRPMAG